MMRESVEPPKSEWPLALMLDEVWLRMHRTLVHGLEMPGLWPTVEVHKAFLKGQKAFGEELKRHLLRDVFGDKDYSCLSSETIFGPSNYRFRTRLPFVLAFGYELGVGFDGLLNNGRTEHSAEVGELCAVFNFGISIFDLVYDHYPDLFETFSQTFNEQSVLYLQNHSKVHQELVWENISARELRILLKSITWFFARLHLLYERTGKTEVWDRLFLSLLEAYRAELSSGNASMDSNIDPMAVSCTKSTLPFAIMYQVAGLSARNMDLEVERAVESLVTNVARIFWTIDDLVDIVRDFQSGALNSILFLAGVDRCQRNGSRRNYRAIARLLEQRYLEEVAEDICVCLASVIDILQSNCFDSSIISRFRQVVLSYLRNWME